MFLMTAFTILLELPGIAWVLGWSFLSISFSLSQSLLPQGGGKLKPFFNYLYIKVLQEKESKKDKYCLIKATSFKSIC